MDEDEDGMTTQLGGWIKEYFLSPHFEKLSYGPPLISRGLLVTLRCQAHSHSTN